jgi:hypothetical protein
VNSRFKRLSGLGLIAGLGVALTFVAPLSAGADTGYPGTTTTTAAQSVVPQIINLTIPVGSSQSPTLCGWEPGAALTIVINGTTAGTFSADSSGCLVITYSATDPHLSANGGPAVSAVYGSNISVITGEGNNGSTLADQVTVIIPTPAAAAGSGSGLAFTGADIALMTVGALLLIGLGTLLVMFSRRRSLRRATV